MVDRPDASARMRMTQVQAKFKFKECAIFREAAFGVRSTGATKGRPSIPIDDAGVKLNMGKKSADVRTVPLENRLQKRRKDLPAHFTDAGQAR